MGFTEELTEKINSLQISKEELVELIGCSRRSISYWFSNEFLPAPRKQNFILDILDHALKVRNKESAKKINLKK